MPGISGHSCFGWVSYLCAVRNQSTYQRRSVIARWAAMLVMLLLLNMVIDVGNSPMQVWTTHQGHMNVTTVNDIETLYEWAMESLLDLENAVPETDTPDEEAGWAKKSTDWCTQSIGERLSIGLPILLNKFPSPSVSLLHRTADIIIPPPRA